MSAHAQIQKRPRLVPRLDRARSKRHDSSSAVDTLAAGASSSASIAIAASSHEATVAPAIHIERTASPAAASPVDSSSSSTPSSGATCPHCSSTGTVEYEASIGLCLCSSCGRISGGGAGNDGVVFREDIDGLEDTGEYISHLSTTQLSWSARAPANSFARSAVTRLNPEDSFSHSEAIKRMRQKAFQLLHTLRLPKSLGQQALRLMHHATNGTHGAGRWVEILLGASIYALCRMTHRPMSLLDVANSVQTSGFRLGRLVKAVCVANGLHLPELDPAVFVDRILAQVAPSNAGSHSVVVESLRANAHALLHLAREQWISIGRSPSGVCGAAVALVMEGQSLAFRLEDIATIARCSTHTLQSRQRELRTILFDLARSQLPWLFTDLPKTKKQRSGEKAQMGFVLEQLEILVQMRNEEEERMQTQALEKQAALQRDSSEDSISSLYAASTPTSFGSNDSASPSQLSLSHASSVDTVSISRQTSTASAAMDIDDVVPAVGSFARGPVASDPPAFKRSVALRRSRLLQLKNVALNLERNGVIPQPEGWRSLIETELASTPSGSEQYPSASEARSLTALLEGGVSVERIMQLEGPLYGVTPSSLRDVAPNDENNATSTTLEEGDLNWYEERMYICNDAEVDARTKKQERVLQRVNKKRAQPSTTKKAHSVKRIRRSTKKTTGAA
jgi:transcription initiation factor TFIIIB Brf1 subunit/transcription initiation factor TFIIB